jgi:transcriptional regulator with GAF, ATPase, and Fis domain
LQTNRHLKSRHTAEVFCISDFWHERGNASGPLRRATRGQEPNSNNAREEPLHLPQSIDSSLLDEDIFGSAEALLPALVYVPSAAATDCTVLMTGEIGTGTELVARAIHSCRIAPPRRSCAQIARRFRLSGLLGSYSVARKIAGPRRCNHIPATSIAKGGTIFLESLGNLSAEAQFALLRVFAGDRISAHRTPPLGIWSLRGWGNSREQNAEACRRNGEEMASL